VEHHDLWMRTPRQGSESSGAVRRDACRWSAAGPVHVRVGVVCVREAGRAGARLAGACTASQSSRTWVGTSSPVARSWTLPQVQQPRGHARAFMATPEQNVTMWMTVDHHRAQPALRGGGPHARWGRKAPGCLLLCKEPAGLPGALRGLRRAAGRLQEARQRHATGRARSAVLLLVAAGERREVHGPVEHVRHRRHVEQRAQRA
jgi:hypothetical protein